MLNHLVASSSDLKLCKQEARLLNCLPKILQHDISVTVSSQYLHNILKTVSEKLSSDGLRGLCQAWEYNSIVSVFFAT